MIERILAFYNGKKEVIHYLIVGAMTTFVSLGIYYGCVLTFLDPDNAVQLQIANILSWIGAVTFAYFTNRKFVFNSSNQNVAGEAAAFFLARVGTLLMDMAIMFVAVTLLSMNDKLAKILVQVVVLVANYVVSKFLVFRKKGDR